MPRLIPPPNTGLPAFHITPEVCQIAQSHMAKGCTEASLAGILGITPETLIRKKKEFPKFYLAIMEGKSQAQAQVEGSLFKNAITPRHNNEGNQLNDGDTKAQDIWLSRRGGPEWKKEAEVQVNLIAPLFKEDYSKDREKFLDAARPRVIDAAEGSSGSDEGQANTARINPPQADAGRG